MGEQPIKVFLDANVLIRTGRPPGGPIFERLVDLVNAGLISVITTDLTIAEVTKKHAENDYNVIKEVGRRHFRSLVSELFDVDLPEVGKSEIRDLLAQKLEPEIEKMFVALKAKILSIDDVKPSAVFKNYTEGTSFFAGDAKKDQFPDAFIFECLRPEASKETPLVIVSDDGDFDGPVDGEEHVSILKAVPDLFKQLGLEIDAPEIDEFLDENLASVLETAEAELAQWGLQAIDVEDAYIEQTGIVGFDLSEITAFGQVEEEGSILVVGTANIKVAVSYTHPNWDDAIYDSEDKVLIPLDDVSGDTIVELEAEFSMNILVDEEGKPTEIEEFRFRNDKFIWVNLYSPWEY